jgi:hypothetical protein
MRSRTFEIALAGLLCAGLSRAQTDATELLRRADAAKHGIDEGVIRIRASMKKKDETQATPVELEVRVKGGDRMRCTFVDGPQKGREVLAVGEKTWLLVPGASRPIPVSASQKLLGGASLGEIGRLRLFDTYTATRRPGEEEADGVRSVVLDLAAKSKKAQYPKGVLWVGKEDELPRLLRLSLSSGKEAKEIRFVSFERQRGKTVLRRMEVRHLLYSERGTETTLEFLGYEPESLPDSVFEPVRAP